MSARRRANRSPPELRPECSACARERRVVVNGSEDRLVRGPQSVCRRRTRPGKRVAFPVGGALREVIAVAESSIEWTQMTWNPTTGCNKTSPGCDHCYALTLAKRLKAMGSHKYQIDGDPRTSGPGFGLQCHEDVLEVPRAWRQPKLVFVNSMSDLFHEEVPDDFIRRVFEVMRSTPQHTYQVLTKRSRRLRQIGPSISWPVNVWMGVSVESTSYSFRLDHLRQVPAAVRFLSAEPLLGPLGNVDLAGIDWVIAGGESGAASRPMDIAWGRELRDQCARQGVNFFFKQWGGRTPKAGGRELDGRTWDELPTGRARAS
jgi:protein gp37